LVIRDIQLTDRNILNQYWC